MSWIRVGSLQQLPPGTLAEVKAGAQTLAVCNLDGRLHAFQGECPHLNGPLGHGNLYEGSIICPWHGWEFRCDTGEFNDNPAIRLKRFAVEVRQGDIYVAAEPR